MDSKKVISVLETTRLMFEMSLPSDDCDCDKDTIEAREDNEETIEAINEAIKALKREPCTDAVSREAVIKSLCELGYGDEENGAEAEYMSALWDVADKVKALPPVTPERPKGEWIRVDNTKCKCSKCEVIHMIAQYPAGHIDWCPNCGADMRGGKE